MNIFILSHSSGIDGLIDFYTQYLFRNNRFKKIYYLSHPLDCYNNKDSLFYINYDLKYRKKRFGKVVMNLFIDFFYSLKIIRQYHFDIFVGANNFDTLVGIVARRILRKKINKIIYYPSDFSEDRFNNALVNKLYYFIEKYVLKNSDLMINNTQRSAIKRRELGMKDEKSIIIPNGVYLENPVFLPKKIEKDQFIYVGNVTEEHGLYEIITILEDRIRKLVVIGQGNLCSKIQDLCKKNLINLELYYKKSNRFVIKYLTDFQGYGLAPYNLSSKWTHYCSPLKVNEYISCGVPVIMSTVPEISKLVQEKKLGIAYSRLQKNDIVKQLDNFDTLDYYKRAEKFYQKFCWDYLFENIKYE